MGINSVLAGIFDNGNRGALRMPQGIFQRREVDGGSGKVDARRLADAFTGRDSGINLYSALLRPPVEAVVDLCGYPILTGGDEPTQDALNELQKKYIIDEAPGITRSMLLNGTAWRWARYSPGTGNAIIEAVNDGDVDDYVTDRDINKITEIVIRSQERRSSGGFFPSNREVTRSRVITPDTIREMHNGRTTVRENFFRTMPVPFSHDAMENDWRGVSVYEPIYRTAKAGHDVLRQAIEVASRYKPKVVQTLFNNGSDTVKNWLDNMKTARNETGTVRIDPLGDEVFLNIAYEGGVRDETDIKFLSSDALTVYEKVLEIIDHHIVIGSGLPELFWSQLSRTNYAGAEIAAALGVKYIRGVQREQTKWYERLANDWLKIRGYLRTETYGKAKVSWSSFDLMTASQLADVYGKVAGAMAQFMQSGATTEKLQYYFIKKFFEDAPVASPERYTEEMLAYANVRGEISGGEPADAGWGTGE